MNIYQKQYRDKLTTVDEALSRIRDHDVICGSQCGIEPTTVYSSLHRLADRCSDIRVMTGMCFTEFPFMCDPKYKDIFKCDVPFFMSANRASHKLGMTSIVPGNLHNAAMRWMDVFPPRVFVGQATPMDSHGFMQLSLCLIHEREAFEHAEYVILEINPNLPRVFGDTEIHISQVDCIIEVDTPIAKLGRSEPTETEKTIGAYVAELVNDGDTIQLGIGGIPDAVAAALMTKHDLGIHTEMFPNSLVDLVEAGVMTGRKKSLHRGKMVGTFAYGDQRLYDLLDNNPTVMMMPGSYVNHPAIVAQNERMVSINTTIAVDLTGQCCSESIGSRQYSGTGGASDTAIGAMHAVGGRAIVAVPSTKRGGTVSSITAQLPAGSVVSIMRSDVDYIITEYGVAPMRGRAVRERVENLIAIAHPDFRAQLREDAKKLTLW